MANELSYKDFPDGTRAYFRDDVARGGLSALEAGKADAILTDTTIALSVDMTYQIPSNFLDRTFIIIAGNRYAWSGSQIVLTDQIKAGDVSSGVKIVFGASVDPTQDKSAILTISNTGLITLTNLTNMPPYLYFHILAV